MKKSTWLLILAAVLVIGVVVGCVVGLLIGGNNGDNDNVGDNGDNGSTENGGNTDGGNTENGDNPPAHTHAFTRQDTSATYLKKAATCKSPAIYYYSCECGEGCPETFESGETTDHNYQDQACTVCGALKPSEGIIFESNGDGTCTAISIGTCTDAVVVVPAVSPAGDRVTVLGKYTEDKDEYDAFMSEDDCNENCHHLALILPEGLVSISPEAVQCDRLMFLVIPDSVTEIGEDAFCDCGNLMSVTLGKGVQEIPDCVFDSDVLFEIYNRSSLPITAGSEDFGGIAENAKNVYTESEGESFIFTDADGFIFYDDGRQPYLIGHQEYWTITDLVLPEDCHGESYAILPFFFYELDNVLTVTIPDAVTSIGEEAFAGCSSLTTVIIGNGVTAIYDSAFSGCAANTDGITVVLGSGIELIDKYVFYFSIVKTVYYNGSESDWQEVELGGSTEDLTRPDRYYYSESEPTDGGRYWHWVDGVPTAW